VHDEEAIQNPVQRASHGLRLVSIESGTVLGTIPFVPSHPAVDRNVAVPNMPPPPELLDLDR
jgi:hypothetical protein